MKQAIRIWEWIKTVLIVLLFCSAAILSVSLISELVSGQSLTHRVGTLLGWVAPEPAYVPTGETIPAAAAPLAISMTGENGRGSTVGEPERTAQLYDTLTRQLGEALATASLPVALEEDSWRTLFSGESVSFLYAGQVPLEALAAWLGAQASESLSSMRAAELTLCIDGARVSLLLRGEHWLCLGTAVAPQDLRQALESCRPDGSLFAIEDPSLSGLDPLSLLTVRMVLPTAAAENALADGDRIDTAAALLGLNPYRDTAYTAGDGTISFTAGNGRLTVTAGGVLQYTPGEAGGLPPVEDSATALIEAARQLLAQLSDGLSGDASLQLASLERSGTQVTLFFDYVLGGYAVRQRTGHAAEIVYENGALRSLTWTARCYTLTGQSETLLPARQAAAIVPSGTRLEPVYLDSGSALRCGWPS